ncbi:MAG: hypothetical protein QOH83_2975, partial [Solirubrobacteraceae bacterium]|nr:hypothetical protein [Solirubrobacteraceae bacterium]
VRTPHCSLKGTRTLAANRHVRVFVATDAMQVLACRRSASRAYLIGDRGECQNSAAIDTAVVAGTFAAINVRTCSLTHAEAGIGLVDLRNGHVAYATNALTTPSLESETDAIRGMVVTPRGRVAWLALRRTGLQTLAIEVRRRAHGPDRHSALLDSGTGIDPRSLRRRGGRVVWTNAGARHSASM